jgi:hypothetical protein
VSGLAADFLASIAEQPLLCIGAVNPGLYAVNPALARAHELRARTVKALAVARSKGSAAKVRRSTPGVPPLRVRGSRCPAPPQNGIHEHRQPSMKSSST